MPDPVRVVPIVAPNPGPFTLEGTNTWIVGENPALVIDPGPALESHVKAVHARAGRIEAILLTHHHADHDSAARALSEASGALVLAFDPRNGERRLQDGSSVTAGSVRLIAVHTPGHTNDHAAFLEPESRALFTGDAVLGRGTSVIDPPEGDLELYVRSLRRMLALEPEALHPGHGPVVPDARAKLLEYLAHRELRERQVLAALEEGPQSTEALVRRIYGDYPKDLHAAAGRTVLAHLLKLANDGLVAREGGEPEARFVLLHQRATTEG
ncbi:MBL fold metallo-hydrolase [soil metagenome]